MDFWKGLLVAQTFITVVYVFFGAFVSFTETFPEQHGKY
jgi:hypothetical protein